MPYEIGWYLPERIIHYKLIGIITGDDIRMVSSLLQDYLAKSVAPTHIVIDATELEKFPIDIQLSRSHYPFNRQNTGWIILCGGDVTARFVTTVAAKASSSRFKAVETLAIALTFLQQHDATLSAGNGS
jgi:hypothetical protein